jgi:hypothetical protein
MTRIATRRLSSGGAAARLDIPADRGLMFTVGAVGDTRADALAKASRIAEHLATDPVLRELLPVNTVPALLAVRNVAAAAQEGGLPALKALWHRFAAGGGKRKLVAQLARERAAEAPEELGDVGLDWGGLATAAAGMAGGPAGAAAAGLAVKAAQELAKRRAEKKRREKAKKAALLAKKKAARKAKIAKMQAARKAAAAARARAAAQRPPQQNGPRSSAMVAPQGYPPAEELGPAGVNTYAYPADDGGAYADDGADYADDGGADYADDGADDGGEVE